VSDAIRRHGKAIFGECDPPTGQHRNPQGRGGKSELSVPGKRHEDIGNRQENEWSEGRPSHALMSQKSLLLWQMPRLKQIPAPLE
jgi:hypothetical protein